MNRQKQSRDDPDKNVRMHRLSLTLAIRMQKELITTRVEHFLVRVLTFSMLGKHFSRQHLEIFT